MQKVVCEELCVTKLCVCDRLFVTKLCVCERLCVTKLCVKELCVTKLSSWGLLFSTYLLMDSGMHEFFDDLAIKNDDFPVRKLSNYQRIPRNVSHEIYEIPIQIPRNHHF